MTTDLKIENIEPTEPSSAELIRRAAAFSEWAATRAPETERARRVSDEAVDEMEAAGLLGLLRPRRWGGREVDWRTFVDVVAAGSRGCGSSGWILSLLNSHDWVMAHFPDAAQERVWGHDPNARICTALTPGGQAQWVPGGLRLSGRWPRSSGIDVCDWVLINVLAPPRSGEGPPRPTACLVSREDTEVIDTWFSVGLCGTGSNDVVVDDLFIADDMMIDLLAVREAQLQDGQPNPSACYGLPMYSAIPLSLVGAALGIAQGALETWIETTRGKISSATREQVSGQMTVQVRLADAEVEIDLAEMLLHRVTDVLEEGNVALPQRYRNRRDVSYAARLSYGAVDKLFQMGGARGLADSNPLQRKWRDIHAACSHVALSPDIAGENQGRHLLGLERNPADMLF